jgi:hypothetical protein
MRLPIKKIAMEDPVTGQKVIVTRLSIFGLVLMDRTIYPNELGGKNRTIVLTSRKEKDGDFE